LQRLERIASGGTNAALVALKSALDDHQANIWTTLPAVVQSFNAQQLTVEAQPTLQAQILQPNGTWIDTTMPLCTHCPVLFPGGGGFVFTFPIKAGDEGLLVFASRCIDAWWQQGGIQKQAELRMHDLSDGFFFPTGGLSQPNVPGNVSTTSAQMRTKDGTSFVDLNETTQTITLKAVNIALLGNLQLGGAGNLITGQGGAAVNFGATTVTQGGKNIGAVHQHTGVMTGGGDTGSVL
jgi:hypothetical protein